MWKKAAATTAWLFVLSAGAPRGAQAFSLPEMLQAQMLFQQVAQVTLELMASAKERVDRGSVEMDLESQGRSAGKADLMKVRSIVTGVEGHLKAARQHLLSAQAQIRKLDSAYQAEAAKARKKPQGPDGPQLLARLAESHREAKAKVAQAYEQAKASLAKAENRFLAWRKSLAEGPKRPGG
ncbi:MAG: hypothetical protein HYT99_05360 [Candidatus Tectomicrobia bacterium]|nr:hypothetical protein [Candidatus Tectomicrobia bacterium]